jgi:hypothetical protein
MTLWTSSLIVVIIIFVILFSSRYPAAFVVEGREGAVAAATVDAAAPIVKIVAVGDGGNLDEPPRKPL